MFNQTDLRVVILKCVKTDCAEQLVKFAAAGCRDMVVADEDGINRQPVAFRKNFSRRSIFSSFRLPILLKFDKMAAKKEQTYYFIFVHEDGEGLCKVSEIFTENQIHASVDGVFALDDMNKALQKVASGGSKGKTIIQL